MFRVAFQVALAIFSAILFSIVWNTVIPIYFSVYVPSQFHHVSFWNVVAMILIFTFLGELIQKITSKQVRL